MWSSGKGRTPTAVEVYGKEDVWHVVREAVGTFEECLIHLFGSSIGAC